MLMRKSTRREHHFTAHTYEELRTGVNVVLALAERAGASPSNVSIRTGVSEEHIVIAYDEPYEEINV